MKPPESDKQVKDSNKDITQIKTQYTISKRMTASYYSIDTKTPLTLTLSHKGRGDFPSLDGRD